MKIKKHTLVCSLKYSVVLLLLMLQCRPLLCCAAYCLLLLPTAVDVLPTAYYCGPTAYCLLLQQCCCCCLLLTVIADGQLLGWPGTLSSSTFLFFSSFLCPTNPPLSLFSTHTEPLSSSVLHWVPFSLFFFFFFNIFLGLTGS